jgi:hypothetical protein
LRGKSESWYVQMIQNTNTDSDAVKELPVPRNCLLHRAGHTPHWIQVLNVAPRHGHVFGRLQAEAFQNGWAFRFIPDLALDHSLPDEECIEMVLFNHDPERLIAALNIFGQVGCWTPGARLFQIQQGDHWYTFDMSREIVSPCEPQRGSKNELQPRRSVN